MFDVFALSVALSVGQAGTPAVVPPPPDLPQKVTTVDPIVPQANGRTVITVEPISATSPRLQAKPVALQKDGSKELQDPKSKGNSDINPEAKKDEEKKDEEKKDEDKKDEPKKDDRGLFMKMLDGTPMGETLKDKKISISGWTQMSYTGSGAGTVNLPVVWNDRANKFLIQQHWITVQKALDTESKEASFGWRVDGMFGTDYRYMMIRGFWNSQLLNTKVNQAEPNGFQQNLYGFDLPQFFANAYLPNLFEGTELRAGRVYTPWGMESVEGVSSPLLSRSYAFNWAPPFFHTALVAMPKFSKNWSGVAMLALGNDTFFSGSDELRFIGNINWKSDDEKTTATFATSLGRGKFNAGAPFNPATNGLMSEAAGRNNFNAFDFVFTHKVTDKFTYSMEAIYAYQSGVPTSASVGVISGAIISDDPVSKTANWWSVAQYFQYQWTDQLASIFRPEVFDDLEGQRTGFKGVYYAGTFGYQYKPKDWLWFRPEIRYDYNGQSTPFNNGTQHHLWTASTDMIIRW